MLKDIYLMNKETGELAPSNQFFREFYRTHDIYASVFDEWVETKIEVETDDYIAFPDFAKVFTI